MADVLVTMNGEGRITIPIAARRQLGLEGEAQFQAEVRDGVLVLRPGRGDSTGRRMGLHARAPEAG